MPLVILVLTAAISLVSLVQFLVPPGVEDQMFAVGAVAGGPGFQGVYRPWGDLAPYLLHVFLHGGMIHLAMNVAALLSFGSAVALDLGRGWRGGLLFLAFFALCAAGGAGLQVFWFDRAGENGIAIGASSAISGLLPAFGYSRGGIGGALRASAPWLLINVVFLALGGVFSLPIAWAAHIGGLLAGLSFPLFRALARA
ncbi:MAG: rhomboid family intramembrane serine protease [Pseudomonadota bacterium]